MTNLGQDEDRKRTYKGPHRQEVQFYSQKFSNQMKSHRKGDLKIIDL